MHGGTINLALSSCGGTRRRNSERHFIHRDTMKYSLKIGITGWWSSKDIFKWAPCSGKRCNGTHYETFLNANEKIMWNYWVVVESERYFQTSGNAERAACGGTGRINSEKHFIPRQIFLKNWNYWVVVKFNRYFQTVEKETTKPIVKHSLRPTIWYFSVVRELVTLL